MPALEHLPESLNIAYADDSFRLLKKTLPSVYVRVSVAHAGVMLCPAALFAFHRMQKSPCKFWNAALSLQHPKVCEEAHGFIKRIL